MKTICLFLTIVLFFIACNKENNSNTDLTTSDLSASLNMNSEVNLMQQSLNNLIASSTQTQRHHWDSLYHHQDSLFWHHHNTYQHNTYTHDDHTHSWQPYDPAINHNTHFHHPYPGHPKDSLITIQNNHHHDNTDLHHQGHDINHHHVLDSLHRIHHAHHP